jgi:predicted CXXCH cytochrome family protein
MPNAAEQAENRGEVSQLKSGRQEETRLGFSSAVTGGRDSKPGHNAESARKAVHGNPGRRPLTSAGVLFGAALLAAILAAGAGAPRTGGWGRNVADIRRTLVTSPHNGSCDQCHTEHSEDALPEAHALIGPDENSLCDNCHTTQYQGGSYGGTWLYAGSAHGSSQSMVWPGPVPPPRTEAGAAGKCLNCHEPHGLTDASGPIPSLGMIREEGLCYTCHSGQPALVNVKSDFLKPFRHPVAEYSGRHAGASESAPSSFASSPVDNRHAECEDCHNSHLARTDPATPPDPTALPRSVLGVSRVAVQNGSAGASPSYTFIPGSDTLSNSPAEYQLCFKCHSSWTVQPSGQTDMAREFNPNNPSYHPVEAMGRNPGINPLSFAMGSGPGSMIRCGDCHGSDFGSPRGEHGSIYRYILKKSYTASSASRMTTSDELCFTCHSYDTYANSMAPAMTRGYSRFNAPGATKGHAEHVGDLQVPCYACHVTHGSADQKYLLVTGRSPGIQTYTETPTGGTCTPTCHAPASYQVNYAR